MADSQLGKRNKQAQKVTDSIELPSYVFRCSSCGYGKFGIEISMGAIGEKKMTTLTCGHCDRKTILEATKLEMLTPNIRLEKI